jgi:uncharacterized protein YcbX
MSEFGTPVGIVEQTWIYPFKGMQGIRQENGIYVSSITVAGDRRYAYCTHTPDVEDDDPEYESLFEETGIGEHVPNLLDTIKFRDLLKYRPYLIRPSNPKTSKVRIITPSGKDLPARSRELKEEIESQYKQPLYRANFGRGLYHSMPVSLLSLQTISEIERLTGQPLDPQRFRENVLATMFSKLPYIEDELMGMVLQFGERDTSAILTAVKKDPRCATLNFHPRSAEITRNIYRTVTQHHDGTAGIYCGIKKEGNIKPGDIIYAKAA